MWGFRACQLGGFSRDAQWILKMYKFYVAKCNLDYFALLQ